MLNGYLYPNRDTRQGEVAAPGMIGLYRSAKPHVSWPPRIVARASVCRRLSSNGLLGNCEQSVGARWVAANRRLDNSRILTPMQGEAIRPGVRPTKPLPRLPGVERIPGLIFSHDRCGAETSAEKTQRESQNLPSRSRRSQSAPAKSSPPATPSGFLFFLPVLLRACLRSPAPPRWGFSAHPNQLH